MLQTSIEWHGVLLQHFVKKYRFAFAQIVFLKNEKQIVATLSCSSDCWNYRMLKCLDCKGTDNDDEHRNTKPGSNCVANWRRKKCIDANSK